MAKLTPELIQKINDFRSSPLSKKYMTPEQDSALVGVIQSRMNKLPADADQIRNPVAKSWNLFPGTAGMYQNAPNIPVAPLTPLTVAGDISRDLGVLGKTVIERGMQERPPLPFGEQLRQNLQSDTTLGSEVAANYVRPFQEEWQQAGATPEQMRDRTFAAQAGLGAAVDVAPFVLGGGPKAVTGILKGLPKNFGALRGTLQKLFAGRPTKTINTSPDVFAGASAKPVSSVAVADIEALKPYSPQVLDTGNGQLGFQQILDEGLSPAPRPQLPGDEAFMQWSQDMAKLRALPREQQLELDFKAPATGASPAPPARLAAQKARIEALRQKSAAQPVERPLAANAEGQYQFPFIEKTWGYDPAGFQPKTPDIAPAQVPRDQGQLEFDFTKGPAAPAQGPMLEGMGGAKPKGLKISLADLEARAAKPKPAAPAKLFGAWHQRVLGMINSLDEARQAGRMSREESEAVHSILYSADERFMKGDVQGAAEVLAGLRGRVDDASFEKLDEMLRVFGGASKRAAPFKPPKGELEAWFPKKEPAKPKGMQQIFGLEDVPDELADTAAEEAMKAMKGKAVTPEDIDALPSVIDDIKAIVGGLQVKSHGKGMGGGNVRFVLTPEGKAAARRFKDLHLPNLVKQAQTTGKTVAELMKERFPSLSADEIAYFSSLAKTEKIIGNIRVDRLSTDAAKQAVEANKELTVRDVVPDRVVQRAASAPGAKEAADFLSSRDPRDLANAGRFTSNMLEMSAKTGDKEAVLEYIRSLSAIKHVEGLMLRHAGDYRLSKGAVESLKARLANGEFFGADAEEVSKAIKAAERMHPGTLKMVNDGIHEYGINMMLYNTDTGWRNALGGAIGVLLNPVERIGNAAGTSLARMRGIKDSDIKGLTEWQEIWPSIKAGAKAVPGAIKRGVQSFAYETKEGAAGVYAMRAKALKRDFKSGKITKEAFDKGLVELRSKRDRMRSTFDLQETEASLGFSTKRKLRSKNPVLDAGGRLINAGVGVVKSTDIAQSHVLREMERTAALVRKMVAAKRAGKTGKVRLTMSDNINITKNILHYTMRSELPESVKALSKWINSNAFTGLVAPFIRAQIALPRFAVQRSPLMLPSVAKNVVQSARGREALDVPRMTRALGGTAATFAGWLYLKSKGIEIHGAARTTEDRGKRKGLGVPQGTYLKFKDGTTRRADDIAPLSYYFAAYAAIDDANRAIEEGKPVPAALTEAAKDLGRNVISGSVFTGTRDTLTALEDWLSAPEGERDVYPGKSEGERLDRNAVVGSAQRRLVGVTTPRLLSEAQRKGWGQEKDTAYRAPRGLGEEYKAAIGFGLQKSVPEQVDIFGKPMERVGLTGPIDTIFGKGVQPTDDPALKMLQELDWYPQAPAKTLDGVPVSQDKRTALLKAAGPELHEELKALAVEPWFQELPRSEKLTEVKKIVAEVMSFHMQDMRWKMEDQLDAMSPKERDAMRYQMRNKDSGILEKWGLDY